MKTQIKITERIEKVKKIIAAEKSFQNSRYDIDSSCIETSKELVKHYERELETLNSIRL